MLAILFHGIDGKDKKKFKKLGEVAKYLQGQDLGPEYRRPGYLQGEFGQFWFEGFQWSDVLEGNPFDETGKYRPELLTRKAKLRWRRKALLPHQSPCFAEKWKGFADGEEWATIYRNISRSLDNPLRFDASFSSFGGVNRDAYQSFGTLEEAKAWCQKLYEASQDSYYKRLGFWDGRQNRSPDDYYSQGKNSHLYREGYNLGQNKDNPRPEWA